MWLHGNCCMAMMTIHSPLFHNCYHRSVLTTFRTPQRPKLVDHRKGSSKEFNLEANKSNSYLPSASTSMFRHRPSTITRWYPPWMGCWNMSKAESTFLARNASILRRSHDRVMASETWSSLWNTSRALMAGFGGMRCGNFPSLNFWRFGMKRKRKIRNFPH